MYLRQVQQLKSVNNLWSDWQLGVREFILVPVPSPNDHCSSTVGVSNGGPQALGISTLCGLVTRHELTARSRLAKSASDAHISSDMSSSSSDLRTTSNSISVQDYFSKYDSSLAKIKENVHRMEHTVKSVVRYVFELQYNIVCRCHCECHHLAA